MKYFFLCVFLHILSYSAYNIFAVWLVVNVHVKKKKKASQQTYFNQVEGEIENDTEVGR